MSTHNGWAIVEIMGHRRHVGIVSEAIQYGVTMLRVDAVVGTDIEKRRPFFYAGASIFGVSPITEEEAKNEVAPPLETRQLAPPPAVDVERDRWVDEVVRCATLAHDGAGTAMVSSDQDITHANREALGRLVAIVEVGIANLFVTAEGTTPALVGEFDDAPDSDAPDSGPSF